MKRLCALLTALLLLVSPALANNAGDAGRWNLGELYPDQDAYLRELASLHTEILPRLRAGEARLRDPEVLLKTLGLMQEAGARFQRLSVYVSLQMAADQNASLPRENQNRLRREMEVYTQGSGGLYAALSALELGYLEGCLKDSRFAEAAPLLRSAMASHGKSGGEEALFSRYAHLQSLPGDTAALLLGADFHPADITRPDGQTVPATYTEWMRSRSSGDENYRRAAYEAYHSAVRAHRHTLAAQLDAHIRTAVQDARSSGFDTPLQQALLTRYELPPGAVAALLENVGGAAGLHRRFGALRLERSGKEELYPWSVTDGERGENRYTYEDACAHILASLSPLGEEYAARAKEMLTGTHIDIYPRDGKQGGAFAVSAGNGISPYILLNFDGSYDSMSTLTHELGHAMHMLCTQENNPPLLCRTPVSLSEIASTAHELLLIEHMLRSSAGDARVFFLKRYADLIGGTIFAQTQLFSFELSLYTAVENGGLVTAELADALWKKHQEDYRAPGLVTPESSASYWAAVPHFYRNFYVLNYAASMTAAYTFAASVLDGSPGGFLAMLQSGGSEQAHALLCQAGVDLTGNEAYQKVISRYEALYNQLAQAA